MNSENTQNSFSLLVTFVPHDRGEKLTAAAVAAGSPGGTVLMGRGLADSNFKAVLGVGESTKDIILMLVENSSKSAIISAIKAATANEKANFGKVFSVDAGIFMRGGNIFKGESLMNSESSREMIAVILNRGYADDAMAAARKAGAGGGTVINARGTAREDDAKFFGMHIVPEKEMLMMIVESEKKSAVLEAIRSLKCLSEPGSGIGFCTPVSDFSMLGKQK